MKKNKSKEIEIIYMVYKYIGFSIFIIGLIIFLIPIISPSLLPFFVEFDFFGIIISLPNFSILLIIIGIMIMALSLWGR